MTMRKITLTMARVTMWTTWEMEAKMGVEQVSLASSSQLIDKLLLLAGYDWE